LLWRCERPLEDGFVRISGNTSNISVAMKNIAAGTFTMGCTTGDSECVSDEFPARRVTLSAFQIGETEVTQAQWVSVMGSNPSFFSTCSNCPVDNVSWFDAVVFCNRLSELQGLTPCYYSDSGLSQVYGKTGSFWTLPNGGIVFINSAAEGYRLPTEAEWEYAARGGNSKLIYSGSNLIRNVAWYYYNSGSKTHPVGQKKANELGLYDMSGNVWEWCADWFGDYSSGAQTNPKGPSSGDYRVLRGGSWNDDARFCRVSRRDAGTPSFRLDNRGFRVARQF
jgi:formylglycine-generating enzyme required for sulfatase activity